MLGIGIGFLAAEYEPTSDAIMDNAGDIGEIVSQIHQFIVPGSVNTKLLQDCLETRMSLHLPEDRLW